MTTTRNPDATMLFVIILMAFVFFVGAVGFVHQDGLQRQELAELRQELATAQADSVGYRASVVSCYDAWQAETEADPEWQQTQRETACVLAGIRQPVDCLELDP